ncbi:WD40 repeat domain-containing protein [Plantactinospora sp. DSM 117369]
MRDLPPLRAALVALDQAYGVTEAHRLATERIRSAGAVLRHPDVHFDEIDAFALSPCGRYLAVGSWCGGDYERGGALQIWEVSTGRCVNVLDGIRGGVGWPGYPTLLQWSAEGRRVAAAFDTNVVGAWDPFGDHVEPIGAADVTNGSGRPPGYAFAPDGTRAYVHVGFERAVSGCLVSLVNGKVYDHDREDDEDDSDGPASVLLLADTLPDWAEDESEPRWLYPTGSIWSRDGSRIFARAEDGEVYAIDVDSRQVLWLVDTETPDVAVSWSPDHRLFAYQSQERLVIADTATGRPVADLPERPGATELYWGDRDGRGRLAVVIPAGDDTDVRPLVAIYDEGEHRYDLDLALVKQEPEESDHTAWAWAPDGERAACLTTAGHIEVWSLAGEPERLRVIDVPENTGGVLWGVDDVLIATGWSTLRFVRATTGKVIGDLTFLREPPGPRPLELDRTDTGDDIRRDLGLDPTFALDASSWAVAFEAGLVIAPGDRRDTLDAILAWTVDRRFAWPTRWGDLDIVPDAGSAAERLGPPLARYLDRFRDRPAPVATPWPPPNTATMDDLYRAALESIRPLDERWSTQVCHSLHRAAVLRAQRGEATGALELVAAIPVAVARDAATTEVEPILTKRLRRAARLRAQRGEATAALELVAAIPVAAARLKATAEVERILATATADADAIESAAPTVNVNPAPRPTQAETGALAEAYATLRTTRRSERLYATKDLIKQAAKCRHFTAVLDLLSTLRDDDFNGRADAAFSALRTIGTALDTEPR